MSSSCWWYDKGCSNGREDAKRYRSSIQFMWQLWPHNQHQKDWGGLSTSTGQALQGAPHYSERSKIASGRQVHLPWKHIVKSRAHWSRKSMPGLPKLVQHLANYVVVFGIEMESGLTQSWKSIKLWCCQRYCMHAKCGQFTNGMPKDWTTSMQAALENFLKVKWQDRIPDTEVPKRAGMQSVYTLLKLALAMLPGCLRNVCQRKSSMEN